MEKQTLIEQLGKYSIVDIAKNNNISRTRVYQLIDKYEIKKDVDYEKPKVNRGRISSLSNLSPEEQEKIKKQYQKILNEKNFKRIKELGLHYTFNGLNKENRDWLSNTAKAMNKTNNQFISFLKKTYETKKQLVYILLVLIYNVTC